MHNFIRGYIDGTETYWRIFQHRKPETRSEQRISVHYLYGKSLGRH
ncbi:hypothetical protein Hanom_Chr00s000002g01600301 [Helianthus anomalus]